nr:hypothetical protein [Tanacetum cinerariifolium]
MAEVLINSLDAGNLLFMQNNDNSNAPIVNVKLAGSDNYKMWSTAIRIAFKYKHKIGFIDGSYVILVNSLILSHQWERCNVIVLGWILGSLSTDLYLGKVYFEIAAKMWDELKETYEKIDGSMIFSVIHKIHGLKQGLNDVYQPIRSNLLAREPLPDVKEAFNIVSREESHRGLHPNSGSSRANQHLTISIKNMFNVIDISSFNLTIGHPNGTLAKITIIGNLRLSANIVLFNVLVPEYYVSLLSVYKLIKDSKLFVGFDEHKCYIQDLNMIKTMGIGNESVVNICLMRIRDPSFGDGNVMASSNIDSSYPVNEEATFATKLDETNSISKGISVEMSGSSLILRLLKISIVEAMNNETEALFRNNTWVLTELPINRKTIGFLFYRRVKNVEVRILKKRTKSEPKLDKIRQETESMEKSKVNKKSNPTKSKPPSQKELKLRG